jgi:hypothetical protein
VREVEINCESVFTSGKKILGFLKGICKMKKVLNANKLLKLSASHLRLTFQGFCVSAFDKIHPQLFSSFYFAKKSF